MNTQSPPLPSEQPIGRRSFLTGVTAAGITALVRAHAASTPPAFQPLPPHIVGITTSSFQPQLRSTDPKEHIGLDDIPTIMRDELGLKLIDLNTTTLGSYDRAHVAHFRGRAEAAGCFITNLKLNLNLQVDNEDAGVRAHALAEYREWIRAAADLGARWVRPLPLATKPRIETWLEGYNQVCDLAEANGLRVLLENYRWLEGEPDAIPFLIQRIQGRVSAQPDTANWSDQTKRMAGLAAAYPHAVSCDFKVRVLTPGGEHPEFPLKPCFDLGVRAGFRGPWAIEHINEKRSDLFRELVLLKGQLTHWAAA